MKLSWLMLLAGMVGCGNDVQGSLRLLLVPPHEGRNPTQDPFELVEETDIGLMNEEAGFSSLGRSRPVGRFGPDLVDGNQAGFPAIIGLNNLGRPVAHGYGPSLTLLPGLESTLSVPFSQIGTAVANRISARERSLPDPLGGRAPSLFLDDRFMELPPVDGPADLSALATLLWTEHELLLRVFVRDDQISPASGAVLTEGDAVKLYLEDRVLTVGADERFDPVDWATSVEVAQSGSGYDVRVVLPLAPAKKNQAVAFDLRVHDRDGADPVAQVTWRFDPRKEGADPAPEDYGRLLLGAPVLDVLDRTGPTVAFPKEDGLVELTGSWDSNGLTLEVQVPDDQVLRKDDLEESDRVELWLDLANGKVPIPEPVRFLRIVAAADSTDAEEVAAGNDTGSMTADAIDFSGTVQASLQGGGYEVTFAIPWTDLRIQGGQPQRGWFLGVDVRVTDVDDAGTETVNWSGSPGLPECLWPEIRLFTVE